MLTLSKIPLSGCAVQRWKNGLGDSREIARDPVEPFRWRLSRATLAESSPFSSYSGYDRCMILVSGGPVVIHHEERKLRRLPVFVAYRFQGEWDTRVEVESAAEDLNLYCLRGVAKGSCYPAYFPPGEQMQFPIAGQEHFIHCVVGSIEVLDPNSGQRFTLDPGDTLHIGRRTSQEHLNLRAKATSAQANAVWSVVHCPIGEQASGG